MTLPRLGFGTASVLGRYTEAESLRALKRAFDLGIRHFDTARSYGWGQAEEVLGRFLRQHPRESYTLVTKCGVVPRPRSRAFSVAKAMARNVIKFAPGSRGLIRKVASTPALQPASTYDVAILSASLETSLQALRTPYLDLLILHNYDPDRERFEDVVGLFKDAQQAGKIRRYGFSIEGDLLRGLEHLERTGVLADAVVQVPVGPQLLSLPGRWKSAAFVAHSPFREGLEASLPSAPSHLRSVFRGLANVGRCEALVTSMFSIEHIERNVGDHALEAAETGAA